MIPRDWFAERPLGFVDVGARGGVHPLVEPIASQVSVVGFEPDEDACRALNAAAPDSCWASACFLPLALSDRAGQATLYRHTASTNDSLLPSNLAFVDRYRMVKFQPSGVTSVTTTTLDAALHPGQGEFLKLDTQGTELEVLMGARRTLREDTAAVYCEVEFAELYAGQYLFHDVAGYLRACGFSFFGFDNMSYRSRGFYGREPKERLVWADAVFFRDPLEQPMPLRQRRVVYTAALLTGYRDFAREIEEAGLL